ncbi:metal-sulfur cluster assembly factor [Actinophytocola sp.]|uniref:metal-sulfur cluster assembly factor n=1 Tax=Actinophytocola sp. TaxID=1872138 RepID=UPI002ED91A56
MDEIPQRFLTALSDVYDPCCQEKGISVVDMGLVHTVSVTDRHARVELLLTSGWCPFAVQVITDVRDRMEQLPDIDSAEVQVVWDTVWTTDRLSDSARGKLRFLPDPAAVPDRDRYLADHLAADHLATEGNQS